MGSSRIQANAVDGKGSGSGSSVGDELSLEDSDFRAVADYTCDWESWHGPDGRLLWVNPAVERITGYSVSECLRMPDYPLRMVVTEDQDEILQVLAGAKDRTSGSDVEFRSLHLDGGVRWMAVSWQPMYGASGKYLGFRTSIRDISERRQLRDQLRLHAEHLEQLVQERTARIRQLEHSQREMEKLAALGQLAAGVAHEINNPLAGIRNAFELVKADVTPDREHFELLELIDREIERMSSIVHQMYQLYRRDPQPATEFEIDRAVADVVRLLESVARKRRLILTTVSSGNAERAYLPVGEAKQILYNLICNAIQASPSDAEVAVKVVHSRDEHRVSVLDHGPGIADDILPRIFEPYFSTKQHDPRAGMGLGLSVSRSLIEAMGGHIEVHTRVGEGSRFTAVFPTRLALETEELQ